MIRFEDIQETVQRHHPDADLEILRKAYIFSAVEHKGQLRASGEPYLVHPLEVAGILAEMHMDPTCVAVGLLHDVLEDTLTEPARIQEELGWSAKHSSLDEIVTTAWDWHRKHPNAYAERK